MSYNQNLLSFILTFYVRQIFPEVERPNEALDEDDSRQVAEKRAALANCTNDPSTQQPVEEVQDRIV